HHGQAARAVGQIGGGARRSGWDLATGPVLVGRAPGAARTEAQKVAGPVGPATFWPWGTCSAVGCLPVVAEAALQGEGSRDVEGGAQGDQVTADGGVVAVRYLGDLEGVPERGPQSAAVRAGGVGDGDIGETCGLEVSQRQGGDGGSVDFGRC